jgi:succinyl-CoA synthetase beta subunit
MSSIQFGVPVPDGHVCYNGASAREWAKRLGEGPWVVKAQIHAGGRGKVTTLLRQAIRSCIPKLSVLQEQR